MLRVAHTPEGIVVRRIDPNGETAYRKSKHGMLCRQIGHRGPWMTVSDFPMDVWEALWAEQSVPVPTEGGERDA